MSRDCPTCGADIADVVGWRCPDCGASRLEVAGYQPSIDTVPWLVAIPFDPEYPDIPTGCLCSHARVHHTDGHGRCWNAACGCTRYRIKEVPA